MQQDIQTRPPVLAENGPDIAEGAAGRDRDATARRILAAARDSLAASGFQGFGVNALARRAGCDKQLIYRYFGGIDGVLDALGTDLAGWWGDRLQPLTALGQPQSYAEMIERMALSLLQALRDDALMQKILLWEITDGSPAVQRLAAARSRGMSEWMQRCRGNLSPPAGMDAAATNAVMIAGVHHIVLAAAATGGFAGMALQTEADWERMRQTLRRMIAALYGAPQRA